MAAKAKETTIKVDLDQVIPALYHGLNVTVGGQLLPKPGDDLEWQFGLDIYPKMAQEPVLAALDDIVRMLTLEATPEVMPAFKKPELESDPDFDEKLAEHEIADEVREYVDDRLANLNSPLREVFWQMLEAYSQGSKLAEQVFGLVDGAIQVVDLKPKNRKRYSIVVNQFYDILGIASTFKNYGLITDPHNYFPMDRFWLFTPKKRDGDPRGDAAFRPCYAPWYDKLLTRPESLKYMRQFGGGMVSLVLPAITQANKFIKLPDGTEMERSIYYHQQLINFAMNGGAFVVEFGSTINVHTPDGEGKAFEAKFDRSDREMCLAFVKSVRAILEAQHGSRADSETSLGLLTSLVNWLRQCLCESFACVIRTIVRLRFGEEYVRKYLPYLVMQEAKDEELPPLLSALSTALSTGVVTPEQMPHWDRKLGQPVREASDIENALEDDEEEEAPEKGATFRKKESKAIAKRKRLSQRYAAASKPLSEHR